MFLITELYSPKGGEYMLKPDDLDQYIPWQEKINAKLPTGSSYMIEIGHNGNGNIEVTSTSFKALGIMLNLPRRSLRPRLAKKDADVGLSSTQNKLILPSNLRKFLALERIFGQPGHKTILIQAVVMTLVRSRSGSRKRRILMHSPMYPTRLHTRIKIMPRTMTLRGRFRGIPPGSIR